MKWKGVIIVMQDKFNQKTKMSIEELGTFFYELTRKSVEEFLDANPLELGDIEENKFLYQMNLMPIFMFTLMEATPAELKSDEVFDIMHQTYLSRLLIDVDDAQFNEEAKKIIDFHFNCYLSYSDIVNKANKANENYLQALIGYYMKQVLADQGSAFSIEGVQFTAILIATMERYADILKVLKLTKI